MIYSINYDLKKPGRDYSGLYDNIKSLGPWWHYLDSTWLVNTHLSAQQIWDCLASNIDSNDRMLIVGIESDKAGWLPKEAWQWMNNQFANL